MNSRALLLLTAFALPSAAQQLELPRPSLGAKVSQTVGLTDVSVDYSSPAARGRVIFGGVVPFGQVWRAGANAATRIVFSKDVQIGGKTVAAGAYALFAIPAKDRWTFIVNKDAGQFGAFQYRQAEDVVRVEVKPEAAPFRERMSFIFSETTDEGTRLDLEWERTRASLPLRVGTAEQAAASIAGLTRNGWRPWNAAASYMLARKDYDSGLRLVDASLRLREDWQNTWTKAQLLAGQGKIREARAMAERAQELGSKDPANFAAADEVKKALAEWKP
ncbi:MAG TPA: DUF2911 domain-containing protein [Myxococcales bacterium]|nr:DUF2911 domain-containing protein [Myxococcales bacterium]